MKNIFGWIKVEEQLPTENELVLGDTGCEVVLVTFCGNYWMYSGFESRIGPIYWCKIPERIYNHVIPGQGLTRPWSPITNASYPYDRYR